ncbi:zinc finger matrin-type protein 3 [Spea bombifrons]|uniref:zinc finger matrin-type protein 3 n=1 Tax=Spea bombifrons TaxID=233779 RepID=UPI00234A38F3|nr:zinc finger matrin-type protein 3 [Spea bombifrons]
MIVLQHANPPPHPEQAAFPSSIGMGKRQIVLPVPGQPQKMPNHASQLPSPEVLQDEDLIKVLDRDPSLEDLCKPLSCKLCNVTLNSAQQAQAHYQGKNHSKKLRNYSASSSCPASSRLSHTLEATSPQAAASTPNGTSSKIVGRVILATENDYCKLCDASFSSPVVAQAHYQGKNHAKRLRLSEAPSNSSMDSGECKRRARKEGNEHKMMQSRRNTCTIQNNTGPYFNPRSRQRIPRDLAMCVTPSGQFYCSMCNAGAGEELEFRQHLETKQHKSKVSEQRYRSEMENLGYM